MSKINNLNVKAELSCFSDEFGPAFEKLINDTSANVGRLEGAIVSKATGWSVGTKGRIVSKEGHTLALPLNAAWAQLLLFGMQITRIATNGSTDEPAYKMDIQADVPACCEVWAAKFKQEWLDDKEKEKEKEKEKQLAKENASPATPAKS
jgi:hypothetical protein